MALLPADKEAEASGASTNAEQKSQTSLPEEVPCMTCGETKGVPKDEDHIFICDPCLKVIMEADDL